MAEPSGTASTARRASDADGAGASGTPPVAGPDGLIRFEGRAMASPLRLVVAPGPARTDPTPTDAGTLGSAAVDAAALGAWEVVVERFEAAEAAMSRFRATSEISRLNVLAGTNRRLVVGRLLSRALVAADRARRVTGGRFDPRVARDLERLGYAGAPGIVAAAHTPAGRGRPTRILDYDGLDGSVRIDDPLDLGGIGKGLAVRWAAAGVEVILGGMLDAGGGFLLDAGGDIGLRGRPPGADGWSVGIENPAGGDGILAAIRPPQDGGVATSSVRRLRWRASDGRTIHHLIDPRTGEPGGEGLLAVTVAGPDPAWAEIWSKALFVEGVRGIAALARTRDLAAWWVTDAGVLEMTPAARQRTTWVAAET